MKSPSIFILLYMLISSLSNAQTMPAGPQVVTFFSDADDTEQPYGLYIPPKYDPSKKYPLVIMLHGAGSNHRLALRRVFGKSNGPNESDVDASRFFPEWKDVQYIVASPLARGTMGYQGVSEKDVLDVLDDVKKKFSIDEDRIYLTGLSMGGGGTLWIGLTRPDIWAALAPVCPAPPTSTELYAANALNIPIHFFHGDADQAVNVNVSREWVKNLKSLGSKVEYREYPGVQHDSWVNAYEDGNIFKWFDQFKRNPFPERVRLHTQRYGFNKAYWVTIDRLAVGTTAKIDVSFANNNLSITAEGLEAFSLTLANHPSFDKTQPLYYTINGGKKIKIPASEKLSFITEKNKWILKDFTYASEDKQPHKEGPIAAAFGERHVYVYGTKGSPSMEELNARRILAEEAANWSQYRGAFLGRVMFFPRVVSDQEVSESDFKDANLILFGSKETNAIIQRYQEYLPFELATSAQQDHGLFYIFPTENNRYVAVSSGLPWWTGQSVVGFRFLPEPALRLQGLKDFVLFKQKLDNTLVDGYFDNRWKVTSQDKAKLEQTGVIKFK
jgi:predicted esterase